MLRKYPEREVQVTLRCGHWQTLPGSLPIREWGTQPCWGCKLGVPTPAEEQAAEDEYYAQQAQYEIEAENAWLRHAEQGTAEDYAFEQYEREMGLS